MLPDAPLDPSLPPPPPLPPATPAITLADRIVALLEVLICSDYPTQLAVAATLTALGYAPFSPDGRLHPSYIVAMSLIDAVALIGLMVLFLRSHGERPGDVFLGRRNIVIEAMRGVPMIVFAFAIAGVSLVTIQRYAPSLHTVEQNPLQELLARPRDAWLFALVVIVAGGIREELQRAFLLHRFERWLGGGTVGVIVTSAAFGAGHLLQGVDATIVTGLLGAFWGLVYLRRRSSVAPIVSHAGFDLLQIVQFLFARG